MHTLDKWKGLLSHITDLFSQSTGQKTCKSSLFWRTWCLFFVGCGFGLRFSFEIQRLATRSGPSLSREDVQVSTQTFSACSLSVAVLICDSVAAHKPSQLSCHKFPKVNSLFKSRGWKCPNYNESQPLIAAKTSRISEDAPNIIESRWNSASKVEKSTRYSREEAESALQGGQDS